MAVEVSVSIHKNYILYIYINRVCSPTYSSSVLFNLTYLNAYVLFSLFNVSVCLCTILLVQLISLITQQVNPTQPIYFVLERLFILNSSSIFCFVFCWFTLIYRFRHFSSRTLPAYQSWEMFLEH